VRGQIATAGRAKRAIFTPLAVQPQTEAVPLLRCSVRRRSHLHLSVAIALCNPHARPILYEPLPMGAFPRPFPAHTPLAPCTTNPSIGFTVDAGGLRAFIDAIDLRRLS
jgi:hypothetical protein